MMEGPKLPADFESYSDARKGGFLKMKELKDSGKRVVGLFCSFVLLEVKRCPKKM